MWAKAATRSPKNVTPKLDTSKLNPSSAAVAAACCQSTCRCRRPRRAPVPQPTSARRCPAPPRGRRDPRSVRLRRSATRLPSPHRHGRLGAAAARQPRTSIWTSLQAADWRRLWFSSTQAGCAASQRRSAQPPSSPSARRWRRFWTARAYACPVRSGWSAAARAPVQAFGSRSSDLSLIACCRPSSSGSFTMLAGDVPGLVANQADQTTEIKIYDHSLDTRPTAPWPQARRYALTSCRVLRGPYAIPCAKSRPADPILTLHSRPGAE